MIAPGTRVTVYLPTATNPHREPKWANGRISRYDDGRVIDSMGYYWVEMNDRDASGRPLRCIARPEDFRITEETAV